MKLNQTEADPEQVHVALLSGLLSHIGMRDTKTRDYQGARNARFAIFPGSGLARKQPSWVMAAELVETSRLWGRDVARIQPEWVEPLAEHLVRRSYSEPRWDPKRGDVVATERVVLFGLPIVAGRTVAYGRIDPGAGARAVHPPRARRGRLGDPPRVRGREPAARGRGRGARGPRPAPRHPRGRRGAVRVLRRAHPGGRRRRRELRPLVARRAPRPPRPPELHAGAARRPGRGRPARPARPPDGVEAGRPRAAAHVPLRARRARRRRDRPRPADRAR